MKIKTYILAGLVTWSLVGCSDDFLDVESMTESNTETFYKTESDAYRALVGCYAAWRETTSGGSLPIVMTSNMMSDECLAGGGMNDARNYTVIDQFDLSKAPSYLNLWENDWMRYYRAIYRCNELLARAGQINWVEGHNLEETYLGETHALRALCYFDMVRMFENIPLLTEPSDQDLPQADPDSVYSLIFSDLKYAISHIPANAYPKSQASSNDGHVTRQGAAGILARAYLYYTGRFGHEPQWCSRQEVLDGLLDIINNAASYGFALIPQASSLWPAASSPAIEKEANLSYEDWLANSSYAGTGNAEVILAMKCNTTQDYNGNNDGNRWMISLGIRGIQNINCSPYGYGWGVCPVNPALVKAFGPGDQRKAASIIDIEGEGIYAKENFVEKCVGDQYEYTGYYVKKYCPMSTTDCVSLPLAWGAPGDAMTAQWQDVIVLRYADVLLMAAELGAPAAQDYFDQVRRRAYTQKDGTLSSYYVQLPATHENIMRERRLEFCFEGHRYFDLLRQGIDQAADAIAGTIEVLNGGQAATIDYQADLIKAKRGLCQIPNNQITLSSQLKQNAGW